MYASVARISHSGCVPVLGNLSIYISIVVEITGIGSVLDTKSLFLVMGIKDDILVLS